MNDKVAGVRSHVIFLSGLIVAGLLVNTLEGLPANKPPAGAANRRAALKPQKLSTQEIGWAQVAWSYFQNNWQPSGLVNSVDKYPAASMWDTASSIFALFSARELCLIEDSEFDDKFTRMLKALDSLPLFEGKLPNKSYNAVSLKMVDYNNKEAKSGIGWSAIDLARLLNALGIVERRYPQYAPAIRSLISRYRLSEAIRNGEMYQANLNAKKEVKVTQEGRLGYEQYAARAFLREGLNAMPAADWKKHCVNREILGVQVPCDTREPASFTAQNYVLSEPYVMIGLEYGLGDEDTKDLATRIYEVQEKRYRAQNILTACSESNLDQAPYFAYFCIYNGGKEWVCANHDGEIDGKFRNFATSSAFAWSALFPDRPYSSKLMEKVGALARPGKGFAAGYYEIDQRPNETYTANGNAVILESLLYRERGPLVGL